MGRTMKHYQDTETGIIHAFDDDYDPVTANNRNIPATLTEAIKPRPTESHVWHQGDWIRQEDAPPGYTPPISSIPSYNPAWIAHLRPYTAVLRDETSRLSVTLDQINTNSYDGKRLAEVVATLPLGAACRIDALVSYDGAIAIPQCEAFPSKVDGVEKLNEILCSLLLGGIHAEVLHSDGLVIGSLEEKKRLFAYTPSLHTQLRLNWASPADRLPPLINPRVLMVNAMQRAFEQGQEVIRAIYNFSSFFLLNGYTAMVYQNNSDALNNLWIAVEQLTEYLWVERYIKNKDAFPARVAKFHARVNWAIQRDQIWAKQQLLRLSKIISKECHKALSHARDKRNDLVHEGVVPDYQTIDALWGALPELIEVASGIGKLGIAGLRGGGPINWDIPAKTNFDEWIELASTL
jgi:hypothetical protein